MGLTRRDFLAAGSALGGGLIVGFPLAGGLAAEEKPPYPHRIPGAWQPNAFIQVTPDGRVVLQIHKTEMGQGILTGLTTLVAEELSMAPNRIETEFAGVHPDYLNPQFNLQITNASSSMITCYAPIRQAAATVRALLLEAAAQEWNTDAGRLDLADGRISEADGIRSAGMGQFAGRAATLPVPAAVSVKPDSSFHYIGKFDRRLDSAGKTDGSTRFGIDTTLPGLLTAVVVRCPHFGGRLKSFDAAQARTMRDVEDIFEIPAGIAVVARDYWHARQAASRLEVAWEVDPATGQSSTAIDREQSRLLDAQAAEDGPFEGADVVHAEYTAPFQAHAPMEPINATVHVQPERVDVWQSTQAPGIVQSGVARALARPEEQVTVHSTFAGGGFGRRVYPFAAIEAALISARTGRPVKVMWSREDDIRHDLYRPAVKCRMNAEMADGAVTRWRYRLCTPSLQANLLRGIRARLFPPDLPDEQFAGIVAGAMADDVENIAGAVDTPYRLGEADVGQVKWEPGIPVSFWRSVGHSFNGFFVEGFIDELAGHAGAEPVAFRRSLLAADSRERRVLDRLVEVAGWGRAPAGVHQGIALDSIKGSVCGQVADVEVRDGRILVRRVVCVVDAGLIVNPDIARSQVESCIVWGLTAALKSEVTIENYAVKQGNFNDFQLLGMTETPPMEIHFIDSREAPVGVGECAVAPVAPAIANAVYRATGQRLRSLPLRL